MRVSRLLNHVSASALALVALSIPAIAQQSLPTIDVGARTHGSGHSAGKPQGAGGRLTGPTQAASGGGSGDGSGSGSYWQQLDEKKKIPEGSYVAPYSSTGTRTDTPIMQTPLNVQVVTPQQLKDRQVTTIQDSVKYVSGVNFTPSVSQGRGGSISLRGFETSTYFRNGFRNDIGGFDPAGQQLANVESVEVLKGSSAILYGLVEPGGIVNIITKQPQEKASYYANQQIGSFRTFRTSVGATGPVTQDKSILYRVDMSYNNAHSFTDLLRDDSIFIAPVVKWNVTPQTQATVEFQYNQTRLPLFVPLIPTYNGQLLTIPRSRNYGEYSPYNGETFLFGASWSHEFDNNWKLSHRIQYIRDSYNYDAFFALGIIDTGADVLVPRGHALFFQKGDALATNVNLVGHFHTGELEHTLIAGGDFYRTNTYFDETATAFDSFIDAFNPIHPGTPSSLTVESSNGTVTTTYNSGAYLQDQINLPFGLHLTGGVRYQNFVQTNKTRDILANGNFTLDDPYPPQQRVTPRVGALWQPVEWLSIYGNYAEGFGPNSGRIYPNKPVPPSDARQIEFGAKAEFFDKKLRATAAYFNLSKTNVPTADLAHPGFSLVTGEVNAKGVEFDLQGEVLPGWDVVLAYSNTEALVTKSEETDPNGNSFVGTRFANVPRNIASLWTKYEFQHGDLKGLQFGGGVSYRDHQRVLQFYAADQASIPGYATVDLMGAYRFDVAGKKLIAQLNVTNLLDHRYFSAGYDLLPPNSPGYGFALRSFGQPRAFMGSLSVEF